MEIYVVGIAFLCFVIGYICGWVDRAERGAK